ncbi:ribonuclease III [Alicyclobacillus tolerans]|uniref:Ribonuclease 3 n=2 Tax=Alicyclobacillus tolerans TaxID=90970 RepID=A0ABT9LW13_9BACL|nr:MULTISPECIES: ribonuclease III [Alicyclobacillus]MDP9728460.1 ribonuclease-3 [Alicyclobacillus tengchongensis]QRF23754.1 ribonuclease III [Alicyclobacillus sp. TC]SHK17381.1 RNAse III [Alicyclobacillus montanus]
MKKHTGDTLQRDRSTRDQSLGELQKKCGVEFRDTQLLLQAFTHASYRNEHRKSRLGDNERLEFLGDAVLELLISDYLYRQYPDLLEGQLTRMRASLVCEPSLVRFAKILEFERHVRLGRGEERSGGRMRPALLADVFEAFIGALYLDQGIEACWNFVQQHMLAHLDQATLGTDYKTLLQEWVQQHMQGEMVRYVTIEERGPAHAREFVVEILIRGEQFGMGTGRSKKEAEQQAAHVAYDHLVRSSGGVRENVSQTD